MGQSTIVEWLNENEQRAYPLLTDSPNEVTSNDVSLSLHKLILDANLVYIEDDLPDQVKLERIESDGTAVTLFISGEFSVPFIIDDVLNADYPAYIRNAQGSLLVLGEELKTCVTAANPSLELSGVVFEPSVASEFRGRLRGVTSLVINGATLVGAIELVEGVQTGIEFRHEDTLFLSAGPNEGLPLDCRNFFENELVYDCGDVVSWINGARSAENGGKLTLKAGRNIKIFEDRESSKIYIGLDFDSEDICEIPNLPPK